MVLSIQTSAHSWALQLGKFFLSLFFLFSSVDTAMHPDAGLQFLTEAVSAWEIHLRNWSFFEGFFDFLLSYTHILLGAFVVLEFLAALFLFLGFRMRLAYATLIILFSLQTMLLHPVWFSISLEHGLEEEEVAIFMRSLAILGGLFLGLGSLGKPAALSKMPLQSSSRRVPSAMHMD